MDALAEAAAMSRGPRMGQQAVGIVDLGSNSVRMVLYERASRTPVVLFNEKVLAELGEGLAETGRLADEAMSRAIAAVRRYVALAAAADVRDLTIVATAASRDAANGADFIAEIERVAGRKVRVLAGPEEAEMAANGVLCGFWRPDGVAGDLGGGSLELISISEGDIDAGESFPLGTLRLKGEAKGSLARAATIAEETLAASTELPLLAGRSFYAIGGTWRSLFRLHMAQTNYPVSVLHNYAVPGPEMAAFCTAVLKDGIDGMKGVVVVSKERRRLVPWGALVLKRIIEAGMPSVVVASALGVREGLIYHGLGEVERRRDPLIVAAEELALLRSRSPQHSAELVAWTADVFEALGVKESEGEARLRAAACLLSDVGWRAHPDYRGDQALAMVTNTALYGIDHPGRGYIAMALHDRYGGLAESAERPPAEALASDRLAERARILALAFRVAYVIAPGIAGILPRTRVYRQDGNLVLWLPEELSDLDGERPLRRLKALAKVADLDGVLAAAGGASRRL
jgi:exopolyphosphatase/guanosine-5'-triphosphate,3'-diphosphate pyrophosphatase